MNASMRKIKLKTTLLTCILLCSCKGLTVKTNGEKFIINEAASTTIEIYSPSELYNHENEPLGEVITSFCNDSNDPFKYPIPSLYTMKTDLKVQTANKGGNALIVTQCGEIKYPACSIYLECTGLAYYLKSWD